MSFFVLTSYFTGIASCVFGAFVYFRNKEGKVNQTFLFLALMVALWAIGIANEVTSPNDRVALTWLRIFHIGVCLIPIAFFHFSMNVINQVPQTKFSIAIGYLLSLFFICLIPSQLFIEGVQRVIQFPYYLKPGALYNPFMLYFVGFPAYAEWKLLKSSRLLKGNKSKQAMYVFIAGLVGFLGGLTSYLPAYNINVYPLMNGFVFLYVFILAVAVVKHHLMDIEVIIKKTLVFAGLASFALAVFSGITFLTQELLSNYVGQRGRVFSLVASVILVVLGYEPLRNFLINLTDRYLFQKKFDYRKLLKEASRELASIKSLKKLARVVVGFLVAKARIKNASAFVYSRSHHAFMPQASRPALKNIDFLFFEESHPLIQELKMLQGPIETGMLKTQIEEARNPDRRSRLQVCYETLEKLRAEAVIPSFLYLEDYQKQNHSGAVLRSILFLGPKKSDEEYNPEDLDVFHTLAQESAIAIENARLYDEAIQKTKENVELKLQLARKQTLANLAGSVAHEIKGPVQRTTFATLLIKKIFPKLGKLAVDSPDAEVRKKGIGEIIEYISKYLINIDDANSRQMTTATTIERFSKMERMDFDEMKPEDIREEDFEKHKVDVYMVLKLIAEKAKIEYQGRDNYTVDIDTSLLSHQLPPIKMNQNMLEQVVINLLLNAYDAMKGRDKKKISVEANVDPADPEFMHLVIKDTGAGIPDSIKEKVWEPSFTTKKEKGTGMGLYLCKLLVEKIHHGQIGFESTPGVGTTFHIKIPVWKEESSGEQKMESQK